MASEYCAASMGDRSKWLSSFCPKVLCSGAGILSAYSGFFLCRLSRNGFLKGLFGVVPIRVVDSV